MQIKQKKNTQKEKYIVIEIEESYFFNLKPFVFFMLRGPFPLKNYIFFVVSNEVSTCSGCCCRVLQLCDVCKFGLGGCVKGDVLSWLLLWYRMEHITSVYATECEWFVKRLSLIVIVGN